MSGVNGAGPCVDIDVLQKRLGRIKKFIMRGQTANYKALSTTVLAEVTALNVSLQASTSKMDLAVDPVLPIRDTQDQTTAS